MRLTRRTGVIVKKKEKKSSIEKKIKIRVVTQLIKLKIPATRKRAAE